jgi:hypothetical protein
MIKLNIEGNGGEIVALIQALQGTSFAPPLEPAPLLAAVDPEPGATHDVAPSPAYTEEQVQKGWAAFSDLVNGWAVNFGPDGDPANQPDRIALLDTSLRYFTLMMAFIEYSQGLTRAVKTVAPDHWTQAFCRQIAENIVSVSSASGVSGFSDTLQYGQDYYDKLNEDRKGKK